MPAVSSRTSSVGRPCRHAAVVESYGLGVEIAIDRRELEQRVHRGRGDLLLPQPGPGDVGDRQRRQPGPAQPASQPVDGFVLALREPDEVAAVQSRERVFEPLIGAIEPASAEHARLQVAEIVLGELGRDFDESFEWELLGEPHGLVVSLQPQPVQAGLVQLPEEGVRGKRSFDRVSKHRDRERRPLETLEDGRRDVTGHVTRGVQLLVVGVIGVIDRHALVRREAVAEGPGECGAARLWHVQEQESRLCGFVRHAANVPGQPGS